MEQPILKQTVVEAESIDQKKEVKDEDDGEQADGPGETDQEFMFKMHRGLVKIQALIRGHLTRVNFKKNQIKKQNKLINRQIGQQRNNKLPR